MILRNFDSMKSLYDLIVGLVSFFLKIVGLFNEKIKAFVEGRRDVFGRLKENIGNSKTIWFHCASLGEFEQAVPVIEKVRQLYPNLEILISFFSPSGFEIKKNTPLADLVVYLPLDTKANAQKFIANANPALVFFVKYEFWPNYLHELRQNRIPTYLISGVFRKNQLFFKPFGGFMRDSLKAFTHFFVQNEESLKLINSLGYSNATISGDTRFDRVTEQLSRDNHLDFAEKFKNNRLCIVFGSTWPEDEELFISFLNSKPNDVCFIIAPHKIEKEKIQSFQQKLEVRSLLHSEIGNRNLKDFDVLIIDYIGLLSRLYFYADIAFVGGAAGKTGLHNILEPATFGVPVVIGKNFSEFPEAQELLDKGGLFSVETKNEAYDLLSRLSKDKTFRNAAGAISKEYISGNTGATEKIITAISQKTSLKSDFHHI